MTENTSGTVTINAQIATTNDAVSFGDISIAGNVSIDTNATNGTGDITVGAVSGSSNTFGLSTGNNISGADITVSGNISGITTFTLSDVGGTATLSGDVDVTTLTVGNTVANVALNGNGSTVTNAVSFANDGTLQLGDASGDTLTFNGGLTTTSVGGTVTLNGTIATSNDAVTLGAVTLGSATTINTNASSTNGDITIGAVTGGSNALTLTTENNVANTDITASGNISGVTTLTLDSVGGTATFAGDVDVATLSVDNTVANVAMNGDGSTITNAVSFANDGTLQLGDASGDTLTFNGGLTTTSVGGTVTLNGTIASSDDAITLGAITLASNTTINSAGGAITTAAITGSSSEDITISSSNGSTNTVTISGAIGASGNINTVDITGSTSVSLGGNISTNDASGNTVSITSASVDPNSITIDTDNSSNDGDITIISDAITDSATINAGTGGDFSIAPITTSAVLEVAAANSNNISEGVFYDVDVFDITAAKTIVGRSSHTGNIFLGNDLAALTIDGGVQVRNSSSGQILLSSDYTSDNSLLTLTSGNGVTFQDLSSNTTQTVNLGTGVLTVTGAATLADNISITATGGISFSSTIDADNASNNDRTLTMTSGTSNTISVSGNIGASQALSGLTITQSDLSLIHI